MNCGETYTHYRVSNSSRISFSYNILSTPISFHVAYYALDYSKSTTNQLICDEELRNTFMYDLEHVQYLILLYSYFSNKKPHHLVISFNF